MSGWDVVVVGGGPAGLMAAGQAAQLGARVLLLERGRRLGTKLRITGKGRCNVTNTDPVDDFLAHFGTIPTPGDDSSRFLRNAFARFFASDLIAFLEALGVPLKVERGGRVFPASDDAHQVAEALARFVENAGVEVQLRSRAQSLHVGGSPSAVRGVQLFGGQRIPVDQVVVATGGASYPRTGSTGDGYLMAQATGHTVIPPRPALVPLTTQGDEAEQMQGLSLRNVEVRVLRDGIEVGRDFGEMLFTHYGVSGPIVLTLSGPAVVELGKGRVELAINLKPALSEDKLDARLLRDLDRLGRRQFRAILEGLLPKKMIPVMAARVRIALDRPAHQITAAERGRLRAELQDFRLTVVGHRPLAEAIVTAGGVSTRDLDPRTLESRRVRGLYFAGEVMNVQADTGGYNLQAAFSTGFVAGQATAWAMRERV
jgi:predicted Rossmann fold flavoprotein